MSKLDELRIFAFNHKLDSLEHEIMRIILTWRDELGGQGSLEKIKEYVDILKSAPPRTPPPPEVKERPYSEYHEKLMRLNGSIPGVIHAHVPPFDDPDPLGVTAEVMDDRI